jgi:hypothetical protein
MNETEARRLLQAAYTTSPQDLAWRRWIESPAPRRPPRRAILAAVIAVCVAIVVAVPVGITLALHRTPVPAGTPPAFGAGTECQTTGRPILPVVSSIEFDRQSDASGTFTFPAAVRITDRQRIETFMTALCSLQRETPGFYHCVASTIEPVIYTVDLSAGKQAWPPVSITAWTCSQVGGLGGDGFRQMANASFWTSIGDALGIADADLQTFTGTAQPPAVSPTPSVSTATSGPACVGSQLQAAYLIGASGGGAGSFSIVVGIRNRGPHPCSLRGWPVLQFLDADGRPLPTQEVRTPSDFGETVTLETAILQTNTPVLDTNQETGYGYVRFAADDVIEPCETVAGIRLGLPGISTPFIVTLLAPPSFPTGQVVCSDGKIQVLPMHS